MGSGEKSWRWLSWHWALFYLKLRPNDVRMRSMISKNCTLKFCILKFLILFLNFNRYKMVICFIFFRSVRLLPNIKGYWQKSSYNRSPWHKCSNNNNFQKKRSISEDNKQKYRGEWLRKSAGRIERLRKGQKWYFGEPHPFLSHPSVSITVNWKKSRTVPQIFTELYV